MIVEHNQSSFYDNAYKFNGKELDDATGMYYYGARYYDPRISIFVSVDPLAEKYPDYTPYHYTLNNPINFVDPDGRDVYRRDGDKFIFVRENNEDEGKKEISGYALSDKPAGGEITGMIIEPYKTRDYENTEVTSYSKQFKAMTAIPRPVADLIDQKVFPFYHFHTHPDTSSPSRDDMEAAKRSSVPRYIINSRFQKTRYNDKGFIR